MEGRTASPSVELAVQIRLQQERDAYEQKWQEALQKAGPFQKKWLKGVMPSLPDGRYAYSLC